MFFKVLLVSFGPFRPGIARAPLIYIIIIRTKDIRPYMVYLIISL